MRHSDQSLGGGREVYGYFCTGRVDYPPEAETRLSFSPLVNRACVNISIFDDNEVEGTETFEVFLGTSSDSSITLRPNLTIIVILDNDQGIAIRN